MKKNKKEKLRRFITKNRYGKSNYTRTKLNNMFPEGHPNIVGRDPWYDRREVAFNYNLIRKYIRSKVGLYWNDVWSELKGFADSNTHVGYKFLDFVACLVDSNGRWTQGSRWSRRVEDLKPNGFYVDEKGVLRDTYKEVPKRPRDRSPKVGDRWKFDDGFECQKIEGQWYSFKRVESLEWADRHLEKTFIEQKFQLNSKTIRKYNLP